ncbi:hypothetical protein FRB94_013682 [Tulasnella sp. JGI-2019a]|nr:hypothetical protein FRB93_011955 [Tulasnella sp. JGI-2019a]KAG9008125.1 hypothetical protein FRB94_013682 [Tulasnella sp. JGI-2019a]KAG9033524.1 hypothetical protein FRB95_014703 [Tulasnella sp. JGI-2019a]
MNATHSTTPYVPAYGAEYGPFNDGPKGLDAIYFKDGIATTKRKQVMMDPDEQLLLGIRMSKARATIREINRENNGPTRSKRSRNKNSHQSVPPYQRNVNRGHGTFRGRGRGRGGHQAAPGIAEPEELIINVPLESLKISKNDAFMNEETWDELKGIIGKGASWNR